MQVTGGTQAVSPSMFNLQPPTDFPAAQQHCRSELYLTLLDYNLARTNNLVNAHSEGRLVVAIAHLKSTALCSTSADAHASVGEAELIGDAVLDDAICLASVSSVCGQALRTYCWSDLDFAACCRSGHLLYQQEAECLPSRSIASLGSNR